MKIQQIPLQVFFSSLLLFNHCSHQDWQAFNNQIVSGYCDYIHDAEKDHYISQEKEKLGQIAQRTVNNKLTPQTYQASHYPGFNPILQWKNLSTQDKQNIKLAVIKVKIIVNLDVFKSALLIRNQKYPFQPKPFIEDSKMPALHKSPQQILQQILNFSLPPYVQYIKKNLQKSTVISKTNLTDVPPATAGYEMIHFNNNGALIKCPNPLPYILLHEFLHIMNYDHLQGDTSGDIATHVGNIVHNVHYAILMPNIPKLCYQGTSTNYDC